MNQNLLNIYKGKIQSFYDKGYSKEEVKTELKGEQKYYEQVVFKVEQEKDKVESFTTLEDIFNYGYKDSFTDLEQFEEHLKNNDNDLQDLIDGEIESLNYNVCEKYDSYAQINIWEVEERIYTIEHCLKKL